MQLTVSNFYIQPSDATVASSVPQSTSVGGI
jgi:hypothetical protein